MPKPGAAPPTITHAFEQNLTVDGDSCGFYLGGDPGKPWAYCGNPEAAHVAGGAAGTASERPNTNELQARYAAMGEAEWFKTAHGGKSLGDAIPVAGTEPDPAPPVKVGCEDAQGLLIVHAEDVTCEVCAPAPEGPTGTIRDIAEECWHERSKIRGQLDEARGLLLQAVTMLTNEERCAPSPGLEKFLADVGGVMPPVPAAPEGPTVKSETPPCVCEKCGHVPGFGECGYCGCFMTEPAPIREGSEPHEDTINPVINPDTLDDYLAKNPPPVEGSEPAQEPEPDVQPEGRSTMPIGRAPESEIPAWAMEASWKVGTARPLPQDWQERNARLILAAYAPEREKVERLEEAVAFFCAVIKSGGRWTHTCETVYARALAPDPSKR